MCSKFSQLALEGLLFPVTVVFLIKKIDFHDGRMDFLFFSGKKMGMSSCLIVISIVTYL